MAELKSKDVANFASKPDLSTPIFLVYGPDRGLGTEIVKSISAATKVDIDDPFATIKMSLSDNEDPERLINEAYTVGMFASARLIVASDVSNDKAFVSQVNQLVAEPPQDTFIILKAGELKKGSALRSAIEKSRHGLAIPCYSDDERSVAGLIETVFSQAKITIDSDARQYLMHHLGGDRGASRMELEKVVLYCSGQDRVSLADVENIVGDASQSDVNAIIDHVFEGNLRGFDRQFQKFQQSNQNINALMWATLRQFQMIDVLRGRMDMEGKPAKAVVSTARPPIFFVRQRLIENTLNKWTSQALRHAIARLHAAELSSRSLRGLDYSAVHMCLMALTIQSARRR